MGEGKDREEGGDQEGRAGTRIWKSNLHLLISLAKPTLFCMIYPQDITQVTQFLCWKAKQSKLTALKLCLPKPWVKINS